MARKPSDAKIIEAFNKTGGIILSAAVLLGVTRQSVHNWINKNPELKAARDNADESMNDMAESMLFKNIKAGKEASIFFRLKTKAKHRGYVETQEIRFDKNDVIEVGYKHED